MLTDSARPNLDLSLNACSPLTKVHQGACLSPTCSSALAPGALCCWTWHRVGQNPSYPSDTAVPRGMQWPLPFSLASNTANCCLVYQTRQKHT